MSSLSSSSFSSSTLFVLCVLSFLFSLLTAPSHSLTCTSQSSSLKKKYANCTDLSVLNATLHYTYNATNSSLSIAYIAKPANSGAWVSWAINPTDTGMIGAQALMALKPSNGSIVGKTYNISSYRSIVESKLSFDVWDFTADETSGTMRIFASVKVPENAESVNQVWQVGGAVNGSQPEMHPLNPENKESRGVLQLKSSSSSSPTPAPPGTTTTNGTTPTPTTPASSSVRNGGLGLVLSFLAAVVVVGVF